MYDSTIYQTNKPQIMLFEPTQQLRIEYDNEFEVLTLRMYHDEYALLGQENRPLPIQPDFHTQKIQFIIVPPQYWDAHVERISEWCRQNKIDSPIIQHDPAVVDLLRLMSERLSQLHLQNAKLMLEIGNLRELHENLHNTYDKLRGYIAVKGLANPLLTFVATPDKSGQNLPRCSRAEQILPIDLRRVGAFSLFNSKKISANTDAKLSVSVLSPDDDSVQYSGIFACKDIPVGWVNFAFEAKIPSLRQSGKIILQFPDDKNHTPEFLLSMNILRSDKAVVYDNIVCDKALALKVWEILPGTQLSVTSELLPLFRLDRKKVDCIEYRFSPFENYEDVSFGLSHVDFKRVYYTSDTETLLVHPVQSDPTLALLKRVVPPFTETITAEVETMHEDAAEIDYALIDLENDQVEGDLTLVADKIQNAEWWTIPAKTQTTLTLKLSNPGHHYKSLLLMTRISADDKNYHCWAHFKRIIFFGKF